MKKNLTRAKIALIAAGASMLTSAISGTIQAFNIDRYGVLEVSVYVVARVIGDLPSATICFGLVYFWLKVKGINENEGTHDHV